MWSNISGTGAGPWAAQPPLTDMSQPPPAHGGLPPAPGDDTAERPPSPLDLSLRRYAPVTGSSAGSVEPPRLSSPMPPADLIVIGSGDEDESPGCAKSGGRTARQRSTGPSAEPMGAGTSPAPHVSTRQAFPLRHLNDPSQLHPQFAAAFGELATGVEVRQAVLHPASASALARRMGLSPAEMSRVASLLQADVLNEMRGLVSGSGTRPRYSVRLLRPDELQPHEQGLVGHPGLFALPEDDPVRRHTAGNGRMLGLFLTTSMPRALYRQNPAGGFERVHDAEEPAMLCGVPVPQGSIDDVSRLVVLPNTALRPGLPLRVDEARINSQVVSFQMELVDATRRVCLYTVLALVGMDELYGPQHPTREVRIAFGEAYLREIERAISAHAVGQVRTAGQLAGPGVWLQPGALPSRADPTPTATPASVSASASSRRFKPITPGGSASVAPGPRSSSAVARHPTLARAIAHEPVSASAAGPSRAAAPPSTASQAATVPASFGPTDRGPYSARPIFAAAISDWLPVDLQAAERESWPARSRAPVKVLHELVKPWIREHALFPYTALMPVMAELWARGWSLDRVGLEDYMRSRELSQDCIPMLWNLTAMRVPPVLLWLIHQRPRRLGETHSMYLQRLQCCAQLTPLQFRRLHKAGCGIRLPLYMLMVAPRPRRPDPVRKEDACPGRDPDGAGASDAVRTTAGPSTDRPAGSGRVPWRMATEAEIEQLDVNRGMPRGFLRALQFCVTAHRAGLDVVPPQVRKHAGGEPEDIVRLTWMMDHSPPLVAFLGNHPRRGGESLAHYVQRLLVEAAGDEELVELLRLLFPNWQRNTPRGKSRKAPAADAVPPKGRTTKKSLGAPADATAADAPSRDRSPLRASAPSPEVAVASDVPVTEPPVRRPSSPMPSDEPPPVVRADSSGDASRSPVGTP